MGLFFLDSVAACSFAFQQIPARCVLLFSRIRYTHTYISRCFFLLLLHWHENLILYLSSFYSAETNVAVFVIIIVIVVIFVGRVVLALYISFYKSSTADVVARYFHYSTGFFLSLSVSVLLGLAEVLQKRNMAGAFFVCSLARFLL